MPVRSLMPMTIERWTSKFFTAVWQGSLILILTFLLSEAAFRVFHAWKPSFIFSSDSYNRFRPAPGTEVYGVALNAEGFKDVEPRHPKGDFRIVAIGDSFAYSVVPYEFNYLTLLEERLSRSLGDAEVLNMGIPSTDVADYREILTQEGMAYRPDLVLVGFFIGNDFVIRPRKGQQPVSYVAELFHFLFNVFPHQEEAYHREGYADDRPTFSRPHYFKMRSVPLERFLPGNTFIDNNLEVLVAGLKDMQRLSHEQGSDFVVSLLPDELQVDREFRRDLMETSGTKVTEDEVDWRRPNRLLTAALNRAGVPVVDLLPAFEEAGQRERLYKPNDTHWNIAGNRLAADALFHLLKEGPLAKRLAGATPAATFEGDPGAETAGMPASTEE